MRWATIKRRSAGRVRFDFSPSTTRGAAINLGTATAQVVNSNLTLTLSAVNTFDAVYMMTQGGPGVASANLPFYIYQRAFLGFDIGQAAAMGVIVVVGTMVVASFALRLIFKSFTGKEEAA